MNEEAEGTPEAENPAQEARAIYQEYVDFWEKDPPQIRKEGQEKLVVIARGHDPERQGERALNLARQTAEFGYSYPCVMFLEMTDLPEVDKWQILFESIEKEAEKSTHLAKNHREKSEFLGPDDKKIIFDAGGETTQRHEESTRELKDKAEKLRRGIDALS